MRETHQRQSNRRGCGGHRPGAVSWARRGPRPLLPGFTILSPERQGGQRSDRHRLHRHRRTGPGPHRHRQWAEVAGQGGAGGRLRRLPAAPRSGEQEDRRGQDVHGARGAPGRSRTSMSCASPRPTACTRPRPSMRSTPARMFTARSRSPTGASSRRPSRSRRPPRPRAGWCRWARSTWPTTITPRSSG